LIIYVIDKGLRLGATYVEARYHRNHTDSVMMRGNRVIGAGADTKEGVGIRVLVDGSLGFAATNNLSKEGAEEALRAAITRARSVAKLRKHPIEFSNEFLGRASYSVITKRRLEELSVEERLNLGKELWSNVQSSVRKVKIPAEMFELMTSIEEKLIINSDGGQIHSVVPRVSAGLNVVLADSGK